MSSALTHIDWVFVITGLILFMACIFAVNVLLVVVFDADKQFLKVLDTVLAILATCIIAFQFVTAYDNFEKEDLVIAQNFTLSKSKTEAIDSFNTVTFEKVKNARYDKASAANEFRPLNDKITFTVLSVSNEQIVLQDEHDKEIKLTKKSHPRVFSALQKLLK